MSFSQIIKILHEFITMSDFAFSKILFICNKISTFFSLFFIILFYLDIKKCSILYLAYIFFNAYKDTNYERKYTPKLKNKNTVSNKNKQFVLKVNNCKTLDENNDCKESNQIVDRIIDKLVKKLIVFFKNNNINACFHDKKISYYIKIIFKINQTISHDKLYKLLQSFNNIENEIQNISFSMDQSNLIKIIFPNSFKKIGMHELISSYKNGKKEGRIMIPIGFSSDTFNFSFKCLNEMPHLMVVGATGTGKSNYLHLLVTFMLTFTSKYGMTLYIIDPKRSEFSIYNEFKNIGSVVYNYQDISELIESIFEEMHNRFELFSKNNCRSFEDWNRDNLYCKLYGKKLENIVLIIDEFSEINNLNKEIIQKFYSIIRMSRSAGIFCILATQRSTADVLNGNIRNNITSRIAFKTKNKFDSNVVINNYGAENIKRPGEIMFLDANEDKCYRCLLPFLNIHDSLT